MTEGWRERGGAAAGAGASPVLPAAPAPAHCQVQCQGHARASATARRNAGAAGGSRQPSRQCLTDDRAIRRIRHVPHVPTGHLTNFNFNVARRESYCDAQVVVWKNVTRVGIPAVNSMCVAAATPPTERGSATPTLLCNDFLISNIRLGLKAEARHPIFVAVMIISRFIGTESDPEIQSYCRRRKSCCCFKSTSEHYRANLNSPLIAQKCN
ncbi:uncharacterized protein isoform X2 [Choristoneura fumiferana]|uniref:uncharacterized protein isoform X2 n=1 Tax=Choristoneura fumiferana TaxID=7141 RepID=UPI003D157201